MNDYGFILYLCRTLLEQHREPVNDSDVRMARLQGRFTSLSAFAHSW